MTTRIRELRPPVDPVHGTMFVPEGGGDSLGVVLLGGSDGAEPKRLGEHLAAEGIPALSVSYFREQPPRLRRIPLEYFAGGAKLLKAALPQPARPPLIFGVSRGSEAALLTAVHFPGLVSGVIAAVPGNVVLCSWPPGEPAWTLDGKPLPYVSRFGPYAVDPNAVIPVEKIPGPILLFSAGADERWPSTAMARAMAQRLAGMGHPAGHQLFDYPGATHALGRMVPVDPTDTTLLEQTSWPEDVAARADAWPKLLAFVRSASRGSASASRSTS